MYEATEALVAPDHTWLPCFSPGGWRCPIIRRLSLPKTSYMLVPLNLPTASVRLGAR